MKKFTHMVIILALALPMIIFGLNKFLGFANVPPPEGQEAQAFLGAMFTSYLAKLVGIAEILGGLLMLNRRTSFVGLLLLTPVIVNIAVFHMVHDMPGNGIWIFPVVAYIAAAARYTPRFKALVTPASSAQHSLQEAL